MSPKALPLAVQLLLAFVGVVVGATVTLTVFAYRSTLENLEQDAARTAALTAQSRQQLLTQALSARQQRARGFLVTVESACGERTLQGRLAFAGDCVVPILRDFRDDEGALGVVFTNRGRRVAGLGAAVAVTELEPPSSAALVPQTEGRVAYVIRSTHGDLGIIAQFSGTEIYSIFAQNDGMRSGGEVFLTDATGRFLTAPRYWTGSTTLTPPGANVEPGCNGESNVVVDVDYRGIKTIHGLSPVAALGGACVHAHMEYDEALAPAEQLWNDLVVRGALFALLGALLSLVAAQRIAAPVRRLASSARMLEGGKFQVRIPIGGPAEVRELGNALQSMATQLAQRVEREQAARQDAEAANRAKDEFLATVSHELRTPLSAILGWVRLLRGARGDADRAMRAVEAIERNADMQRRLVEDLLDVSRIVAKKIHLVQSPVNLSTIVEKALDAVRPQAEEKSVTLETALEEDLTVMGDPDRLLQVVLNLASNAVKFTPSGGWVRLTSRRAGAHMVELSVRDNGEGIRPSFLPHVFDWFRQANPAGRGSQAGLGLGLGIVKYLTQLHGGSIRAESAGEGQGAAFVVRLPLYIEEAQQQQQQQQQTSAPVGAPYAPGAPRLDGIRALVVDDDEETRSVLRSLLEGAGATVATAGSAEAARRSIEQSSPDVLVSDIAMPGEDGYALIQSLRAANINLPAIALTALARREDAHTALTAGYQLHMLKPADPEALVRAVADLYHASTPRPGAPPGGDDTTHASAEHQPPIGTAWSITSQAS